MVIVKNPDRHLEKYLKDNEYSYDNSSVPADLPSKTLKPKKEKKERTPEKIEADKKRMADVRAKRKLKSEGSENLKNAVKSKTIKSN